MTYHKLPLVRRRLVATALAIICSLAATISTRSREIDTFTLRMDNDFPGGTDSRYTAGTEFDFAYRPWQKTDDASVYHRTLALGQWIFTPELVNEVDIVENDRPYAGWSYLRYGQHRTNEDSTHSWQLTLGIVGPSSFAEDIQRSVHDLINDKMPLGWHNQLSDEFGYAIEHERQKILNRWRFGNERSLELTGSTRFSIGNVDTSLSQGFQLKLGRNLNGKPTRDRIGSPSGFVDERRAFRHLPRELHPRRFYWVIGARTSYVSKNLFLDGNSNGKSHHVDKHPFVHEIEAGFAKQWPGFKLAVLMVHRTAEFREQDGGQTFGSLSMTFRR